MTAGRRDLGERLLGMLARRGSSPRPMMYAVRPRSSSFALEHVRAQPGAVRRPTPTSARREPHAGRRSPRPSPARVGEDANAVVEVERIRRRPTGLRPRPRGPTCTPRCSCTSVPWDGWTSSTTSLAAASGADGRGGYVERLAGAAAASRAGTRAPSGCGKATASFARIVRNGPKRRREVGNCHRA